jgi:two-component sensor histidine kinase
MLNGPDASIAPRQVTALGMVLQELMANSLKYGALKSPTGRVDVQWNVVDAAEGANRRLELTWRESGGPPIDAAPAPGQGTGLILGFVRSELRGMAELSYPPQGAAHRFQLNLDLVRE